PERHAGRRHRPADRSRRQRRGPRLHHGTRAGRELRDGRPGHLQPRSGPGPREGVSSTPNAAPAMPGAATAREPCGAGFIRRSLAVAVLGLPFALLAQSPLTLWYRQPAQLWVEALPVGNGRMGAMVFGAAAHERIQFNEQTVWTGEPHDYAHHGASRYLVQIRELLWAARQKEAEDLAMREFMSVPFRQKAYQALGDL